MPKPRSSSKPAVARGIAFATLLGASLLLSMTAPSTVWAQLDPHVGGQWTPIRSWPLVAVSMANLPDGRILGFASNERDAFPQGPEFTYAAVYDPATDTLIEVPHPAHDMFCASLVMLEDGSVFVSGGRNKAASPWTSLYDFRNDTWIPIENMNRGRWYPTSVALPTGQVFIAVGDGGQQYPEIWTPGQGWQLLTGIDLTVPILNYGAGRDGAGLWPMLQLDPSGKIFHHGATPIMHSIDTSVALGAIQVMGPHNASWFPDEGVSVFYDAGMLLVAGGSIATNNSNSSDQAMVFDFNQGSPQITLTQPMNEPRQFHNEILLPTGEVLVVGGNTDGVKFNDDAAVRAPEVWDPGSGSWTLLNPQLVARTYHSTAALLPDGRVISAGGGLDGGNPAVNHADSEIFSPPYLFDSNDNLAARPSITDAPTVVRIGSAFALEATPGMTDFSIVKMSATTHTMNTDLRFLRPAFLESTPGMYDLTLESNANILTPGYWMLFALDVAGVPSVAHTIQIVTDGVPRGVPVSDRHDQVSAPVLLRIEAADPDGNSLTFSATGVPDGLTLNPLTGVIQGTLTQTGIFNVSVTVDDGTESAIVAFRWFVSLANSELGEVTVSQASSGEWHTVNLQDIYLDPVVVMGPPTFDDTAPTTVRTRNVSSTSFEFQIDEWDYLDGAHGSETISYLVIEAGAHQVPGGGHLLARREPGMDNAWRPQSLLEGSFTQIPVVLAQASGDNGGNAVTTRVQNVTTTDFDLKLQKEELGGAALTADEIHWIAVEPAAINGFLESMTTGAIVDEVWEPIAFTNAFSGAPYLLASTQSYGGGDTAALRHRNATANDVELMVEEEASDDVETAHANENVGVLAIDPLLTTLGLLRLSNAAPTVANPGDQDTVEGEPVSLFLLASDDDGDGVTFSASNLPPGLGIDSLTGEILGAPTTPGSFAIMVTVTDPSSEMGQTSFAWNVSERLQLEVFATPPKQAGSNIDYDAITNLVGIYEFFWDFGDGNSAGPSASTSASHTFQNTGRHVVTLTVTNPETGQVDVLQFTQMVHGVVATPRALPSSPVAYEAANDRVWVANPDNHTVTVVDGLSHAKIAEIPVGAKPRSLAVAADGRIWVTCKGDDQLDLIDPGSLTVTKTIDLPAGSRPHGIAFNPSGSFAYIAMEGTGVVLAISSSQHVMRFEQPAGEWVRGITTSQDESTVYVSRFVSPPLPGESTATPQTEVLGVHYGGEVLQLDATSLGVLSTIVLHHSEAATTHFSGPGIPNYLGAPVVSPDSSQAFVPSKQDNVLRGIARDGQPLTHDSTVRAITSRIDLGTGLEDQAARTDHDDASMPSAALFGPTGSYLFVAFEGNRQVAVLDALEGGELGRFPVGRAPQGLALSPDGRTLYVHNFLDRTMTAHDLSSLLDFDQVNIPIIATTPLVQNEALAADVLIGKQHFYDVADLRLALQGYMSCASCHNDGGLDGRTWDFTQFGEGLRNTITLEGHGQDNGPVHWTANFDEIQDFEGQIRNFSIGQGLMFDPDFEFGTRSDPLGDPKAGLSADLDALAAYVESLVTNGTSPHRESNGTLTFDGVAGHNLFLSENCGLCHGGVGYNDSGIGGLHDVGTSGPNSGAPGGLDSPTLRGLWLTEPYLHDGSAATLEDAITRHTGVALTPQETSQLAEYLLQIDDLEATSPVPEPGTLVGLVAGMGLLFGLSRRKFRG